MGMHDVFARLGTKDWFARVAATLAPLDAKVLRATGGRVGLSLQRRLPQCLLTTTGRRSGRARTVTLLYGRRGDDVILIGSNFGKDDRPAWALNLAADPRAVLAIDGVARDCVARQVTDARERDEIWDHMTREWAAYGVYRNRTDRDIKVFLLRPDD